MNKEIRNILNCPIASNWVKDNLRIALKRDIVEASYEAALLAKVLGDYRDSKTPKRCKEG